MPKDMFVSIRKHRIAYVCAGSLLSVSLTFAPTAQALTTQGIQQGYDNTPTSSREQGQVLAATAVNCNNNSGDASFVQNAVNQGGTIVISGSCAIGASQIRIGNSVVIMGSAHLSSAGGTIFFINSDNVTINGLTFLNGGIWAQGTANTKRSNITITSNTFQDFKINNQRPGIECDPILYNWKISQNTFRNFWVGGFSNTTTNPADKFNAAGGIVVYGGLDHTIITGNIFDQIEGDGMHLFNQGLHGKNGGYVSFGSEISYNLFTRLHRIAIEYQDVSNWPNSCPGGCTAGDGWDGLVIKNNYYHNVAWPYWGSFAWSIPTVGRNGKFYNNTAIVEAFVGSGSRLGIGWELATTATGLDLRGNIVSSLFSAYPWGQMITNYAPGSTTNVYTNNILCGYGNPPNIATSPHTEVANYNQSTCPGGVGTAQSSLNAAFSSPNNQSFPNGGNGTFRAYVISNLSIRQVRFFIDGSSSPAVTQELQDVNTNFSNDRKWLYHATFNTSSLSRGSHTIKAVATDVSGASQSITRFFSVGSGVPTPLLPSPPPLVLVCHQRVIS